MLPATASPVTVYGLLLLARLVFIIFLVFFIVLGCLILILILILVLIVGAFEDGERQRFAEQVAFVPHPQARDRVLVDFHHRQRMTAGFQRDDVARFQLHE